MGLESINVLILVLVEHTLGDTDKVRRYNNGKVLILVLVEHTLGARISNSLSASVCLNPCFSGTYSRSFEQQGVPVTMKS